MIYGRFSEKIFYSFFLTEKLLINYDKNETKHPKQEYSLDAYFRQKGKAQDLNTKVFSSR